LRFVCVSVVVWFAFWVSPAMQAQSKLKAPRFRDYPVREIFKGKPAKIEWPPDYPQHEFFRLSIQDLIDGGVNFASHYAVREWSCGTDCRWLVILDMKTGRFLKASPYGVLSLTEDQKNNGKNDWLQIRPDSRLLIASGCFNVESPKKPVKCGTKYFVLEKAKFVLVRYDPQPTPAYFK
jgi:hypothetical protein